MAQKTVKIEDVARQAGVSTATVSRALSKPGLLTDATRNAVFEAIQSTGYRANRAARTLRKQEAEAVLVLVPNLGNPFFSQILAGISAAFDESPYSVLIADTTKVENKGHALLNYFLDSRIDGVISLDGQLSTADLELFVQAGVDQKIVFACEWVDGTPFPSIRSDNGLGARLAIQHLYDQGHRAIAHVTGPAGNVLTHTRREAVMQERQRLDLPAREEWIMRGDFSLQSGYDAAGKILAMDQRPTAVFCASDMVAFGLISGLGAGGLSVPTDVSVVGFDDIELAEYYMPPLTTVRQDRRRLGQRAATQMLERLGQPEIPATAAQTEIEVHAVTLSVRASTSAPKT